jgi:hypothetical protein
MNRNRKETDEEEAKGETHSTLAFSVTFFRVGVSTLHGPHQLLHCPPTIEMSRVEEEEAMRGRRDDDEERRCRKKQGKVSCISSCLVDVDRGSDCI